MPNQNRIVITGVGLTCPGADSYTQFRSNLIENRSFLESQEIPGLGSVPIGNCHFDEERYLHKKMRRRGTRAGSIGVYCASEALKSASLTVEDGPYDKKNIGVYLGITEHGVIETELEYAKYINNDKKISLWSHHQNPRVVANAPAGEVTINLKITGPHYTIGGACAAGNISIIQGAQMLKLGEVDLSLCGGVSETSNALNFFASFKAQGALSLEANPNLACKPLDANRNGIIISEGGAIYSLERLQNAVERNAKIYGEILSYHSNSDATDFVKPNSDTQKQCIQLALEKADLKPSDIDIVNLHATGTEAGDLSETMAPLRYF